MFVQEHLPQTGACESVIRENITKRQIKDARNKMRNPIEVPNKNAQALLDLHAPDSNPASDATDDLKSILKYVNTGLVSSQV